MLISGYGAAMFVARPARGKVLLQAFGLTLFGLGMALAAALALHTAAALLFFGLPALLLFARALRMFLRLGDPPSLRIEAGTLHLRVPRGGFLEAFSPVTTWTERAVHLVPGTTCRLDAEPNLFGTLETLHVVADERIAVAGHWFAGSLEEVQAAILDELAGPPDALTRAAAHARARVAEARWPRLVEVPRRDPRTRRTLTLVLVLGAAIWYGAFRMDEPALYVMAGMFSVPLVILGVAMIVIRPAPRLRVGPHSVLLGSDELRWADIHQLRPHRVSYERGPATLVGFELIGPRGRLFVRGPYGVDMDTLERLLHPPAVAVGIVEQALERGFSLDAALALAKLPPTPGWGEG